MEAEQQEMESPHSIDEDACKWALKLFNKSPLKQRKFEKIVENIGPTYGLNCLDIGSDNGVISYLLRERGGVWYSADLIPETVEAISGLVGERVSLIDGLKTPYSDNQFDLIVIVDFLEHIETDREFVEELSRIIKPGGSLVVNVPNPKEGILRRIQFLLGQTDQAHGHVRPGYSVEELEALLGEQFKIEKASSYSRVFSVLLNMLITGALDFLKKGGSTQKGTVVTKGDLGRLEKSFKLYSLLYPLFLVFVGLDKLLPFLHGNMLIAKCGVSKE